MANSRYIKGQQTGSLPEYLQRELRAIEMMFLPLKWIPVTFQNAWVNFGGNEQTVEYSTDVLNRIYIRGIAKNGVMGASIFTLLPEFRPIKNLSFAQCSTTGAAVPVHAEVNISLNGAVIAAVGGAATNAYVSLNMIFSRD